MAEVSKEAVFNNLLGILNKLAGDWEYSGEITPKTFFVGDLGFESIEIVVLATTIEKYYQQTIPFTKFFAEIGQREIRDIRIDEFVEFIYDHLNSKVKEAL